MFKLYKNYQGDGETDDFTDIMTPDGKYKFLPPPPIPVGGINVFGADFQVRFPIIFFSSSICFKNK
jgi:hypothetical protein